MSFEFYCQTPRTSFRNVQIYKKLKQYYLEASHLYEMGFDTSYTVEQYYIATSANSGHSDAKILVVILFKIKIPTKISTKIPKKKTNSQAKSQRKKNKFTNVILTLLSFRTI